jgi:hypothetical protein
MKTSSQFKTALQGDVSEQLVIDILSKSNAYERKTNRPDARIPKYESSKKFLRAKEIIHLSKKERAKTTDKGMHWFLTEVLKRIENDPSFVRNSSTFNRLFAALPNRKNGLHASRKQVLDEAMNLFFEIADHVTGFIECGCILSISNRLNLSTSGKALYYKGEKVNGTKLEHLGNPKFSTKRIYFFLDFLVQLGFIEMESITCPVTGERLPSMIRLTDNYYHAMGVSDAKLKSFRKYKLRQKKHAFMEGVTVDDYADHIKAMIFHKREQMKSDRIAYRRKLRLSQRFKRMTPQEVYQHGRKLVNSMYSKPELSNMSDEHYEVAVKHELDNLFNAMSERVPPLIQ